LKRELRISEDLISISGLKIKLHKSGSLPSRNKKGTIVVMIPFLYPGDDSEREVNPFGINHRSLIDYCFVIDGY